MKTSKIPGLGRFGLFIDDLRYEDITPELWNEIATLYLDNLVIIIRNCDFDLKQFEELTLKWGDGTSTFLVNITKKYGFADVFQFANNMSKLNLTDEEKQWFRAVDKIKATDIDKEKAAAVRVTSRRDSNGDFMGMFPDGDLLWHANESGNFLFAPSVSFYGYADVIGSSTGFLTTADWYEEQTESFRSELDDMILIHDFTKNRFTPELSEDEQQVIIKNNMCPERCELPMVMQSPGGIKGLHYTITSTVAGIKGATDSEFKKITDNINKTLLVDKYIYDHWYKSRDLIFLDNTISLHRRQGDLSTGRLGYRIQHNLRYIQRVDSLYLKEPWKSQYKKEINEMNNILGYTDERIPAFNSY